MKRLILCLFLLWAVPAHANTPYVVSGIAVDVTADSVTDARNQAILEGSRKAFAELSAQLLPGQAPPQVTDAQLGNMLSDFRVEKEQFGAKRYVGSFTFRFRQNPVRALYGAQFIPSPHELAARAPTVPVTPDVTTIVTTTTETTTTAEISPPVDDATALISQEAAQAPAAPMPSLEVAADNPMPPGVDANSPIKMMLIEAPTGALQSAQNYLRMTPGVVNLSYGSSGRTLHMAYRGDTAQLINNLKGRGLNLQQKLPTQPPIYTLAP